jgi:hypothetical protein
MVTRFNITVEWSTQIEPMQILSNSQLQTTEYKLTFFNELKLQSNFGAISRRNEGDELILCLNPI